MVETQLQMTTYTQMMFNADNRNNPVNVIWECVYDDVKGEIDENGDEWFKTYDEARAWVQKYLVDCQYNTYWKIVDDVTNKNIETNMWTIDELDDYISGEFYDEDEELFAEYEKLLEEKRIEEEGEDEEEDEDEDE